MEKLSDKPYDFKMTGNKLEFDSPKPFGEGPENMYDDAIARVDVTLRNHPYYQQGPIDLILSGHGTPRLKNTRLRVSFLLATYATSGFDEFSRMIPEQYNAELVLRHCLSFFKSNPSVLEELS